MSLDNPHACYWCRQQPCKGGSGNGSCTRREGAGNVSDDTDGWKIEGDTYYAQAEKGNATISVQDGWVEVTEDVGTGYERFTSRVNVRIEALTALLSRAGLALVPAADVQPISDETLRHLRECALAWEPEARVIGDVTAHQLRAFCLELAQLRRENPDPECDNCGATIDGNQAATSDVCFDCWRSAKERAPTPEQRAVLEAVRKVVRERMYATTPACMKVMGEYDSRTLRQVEALLFPPAAKEAKGG